MNEIKVPAQLFQKMINALLEVKAGQVFDLLVEIKEFKETIEKSNVTSITPTEIA